MGNSLNMDSSYGNIFIKTTRSMYTAGDQVDGFVHLNLIRDFPSNVMHLVIQGIEDVKLVSTKEEKISETEKATIVLVHTDNNEFFGHSFPLYSHNGGNFFLRGQYSFPFSFKLLDNLPGTFRKGWNEHGHDCHTEVKYKIWAGLKHHKKNKGLFDEFTLRVDQKFEESSGNKHCSFQKKVQGYCYKDIGEFGMQCIFQNNTYRVGDVANILVSIDNSKGKVNINRIECALIQDTYAMTSDKACTWAISRVLSEVTLPGLSAGETKLGDNSLALRLPIRTNSELEATSTGTLIQNSFRLGVTMILDSSLCCDAHPSNQINVKIFNKQLGVQETSVPIPEWNPQIMIPYVCTISPEYRMTRDFIDSFNINKPQSYPLVPEQPHMGPEGFPLAPPQQYNTPQGFPLAPPQQHNTPQDFPLAPQQHQMNPLDFPLIPQQQQIGHQGLPQGQNFQLRQQHIQTNSQNFQVTINHQSNNQDYPPL